MAEYKSNFKGVTKQSNMTSYYIIDYVTHPDEPGRQNDASKELNLSLRLWLQNKGQLKQRILRRRLPDKITL